MRLLSALFLFFAASLVSASDESFQVTSEGFQEYRLVSPFQAGDTTLRVLLPDNFDSETIYRVLYVLPVHEDGLCNHGDGLVEVKKHNYHNTHQLICVAPAFTTKPWFADHDLNPHKRDESHLLKTVIPFVDEHYPTQPNADGRLLIGFSKSGWGAIALILRNPKLFGKAVGWDIGIRADTGPITEEERAERIAREWGTVKNFEANRLSNLVKKRGKDLGDKARLFYYSTEGTRAIGGVEIHRLLVENNIPHRYVMEPNRKHAWDTGWIPEAVEFLVSE
ncbi:MAG: alpha/beta hydrolase-fold protein [Verrucomicrobia bacterium]|nr:alpha/beta hydrolase-fold protein [Verrucomicrobiota bacterium]MDA1066269.1 alpha/beta hydrolase-fold protein [Verrucomicrobiota bacterium]